MHKSQADRETTTASRATARVVVWTGGEQGPEFQLDPSHVTTIGRHPICDVSLNDSLCSRHHSEIFLSGSGWVIRDLGSRNGTFVDKQRIEGDWPLGPRSVIHVGNSVLMFTLDDGAAKRGVDTVFLMDTFKDGPAPHRPGTPANPGIVSEASHSRFRLDGMTDERQADLVHGLDHLYRMAVKTASADSRQQVADIVLGSVLDATRADIGAVLMFGSNHCDGGPQRGELTQVAFQSRDDGEYETVSASLSQRAIDENRAVLAHYLLSGAAESRESKPSDSLAEIDARSVICAPIRSQDHICGLLHVYSTSVNRQLDDDDLHLTLAAAEHLALVANRLAEKEELAEQLAYEKSTNQALREQLAQDSLLVGESESIQALRQDAHHIAPTDATVLIRGESGVGKELVARTIHRGSRRADRPFVCMNCAALTESLLESELFGHERGAFTGATEQKQGKFEQADGGTLFLDEVGEMSLNIQAKFLRVLEGHPFERVGGAVPINVNVRVVAATNRHLEEAVNAGQFRQDLYFRLHVVQMMIDPLRDRPGDISVLATHFLKRFADKSGLPLKKLTPAATEKLRQHHWPGNVRELQNALERSLILSQGRLIDADDIRLATLDGSDSGVLAYNRTLQGQFREISLERLEYAHIMATLKYTDWNKTRAAEILEIERSTLDRKLKRAGIKRPRE